MSALVAEPGVQEVRQPTFCALLEQIHEALSGYKQRQEAVETIEQALAKARKTEADCLQQSLTSDDPKLVKRIGESRLEIEVNSRRLSVARESLAPGLEAVAELVRQLEAQLIERLSNLS